MATRSEKRSLSVTADEVRVLGGFAALADGNPFRPERIDAERRVLGAGFSPHARSWHADATFGGVNPNVARLRERAEVLAAKLRDPLAAGAARDERDLRSYEALIRYLLFARYEEDLYALVLDPPASTRRIPFFERFAADAQSFLAPLDGRIAVDVDPAHLFAWGFQVRRAFHFTFRQIFGGSRPAADLRAAVWESIFTRDRGRYRRALFDRMADFTTLVVGESGTGKELVARAIALAGWIPCDRRTGAFRESFADLFRPLNLAALPSTLIESELFGHRRGAFTGALDHHAGHLESCPALGSVFLDEIGELDASVQVKLLRVLQDRTFRRVGDTREQAFRGKVLAATNRDLPAEIVAGRFREDLYYRLCADVIRTPSLRAQLADDASDLGNLLSVVVRRIVGEDEAEPLVAEVETWIVENLGIDYPWPGNVRELEQCVRNLLIRGQYWPRAVVADTIDDPFAAARRGELSAEDLLRIYCTLVYASCGSFVEVGRRLGLDRRTVRDRIDPGLLKSLSSTREGASAEPAPRRGEGRVRGRSTRSNTVSPPHPRFARPLPNGER